MKSQKRKVGKARRKKKSGPLKLADAIHLRFSALRQKILQPQLIAQKDLLTAQQIRLFRFGLILRRGWERNFSIFVAGALCLVLIFGGITAVNSASLASKKVLGTATVGLEFLQNQQMSLAVESFDRARKELEESSELLVQMVSPMSHEIGDRLVSALSNLEKAAIILENTALTWDVSQNSSNQDLYLKLKESREAFLAAGSDISAIEDALELVPAQEIKNRL